MVLFILRGAFLVLVTAVISLFVGEEFQQQAGFGFKPIAAIIGVTLALAAAVIAIDVSKREKKLSAISGVFLGLLAGMTAAYALSFVVDLVGVYTAPTTPTPMPTVTEAEYETLSADVKLRIQDQAKLHLHEVAARDAFFNLLSGIKVIIGLITCYIAISLVIQTKDDFRFIIPYVEFAKEIRGGRPIVLDTSVIIDGRIVDIIETRLMQGTLVAPKFVIDELQQLADSSDKIKRARGRRGLDMLKTLQGVESVDIHIDETDAEGNGVDEKLLSLARQLKARVMTNDFNLNKVAAVRGVEIINLNDLAKALRPVALPGETLQVRLVKPGESGQQGVGYLDDGTMVVVENGRDHLNQLAEVSVTSTLQTSAGRMIFASYHDTPANTPTSPPTQSYTSGETTTPPGHRARPSGNHRNPRRG